MERLLYNSVERHPMNSVAKTKSIFTPKQALRRYYTLFIPSMTTYIIAVFIAVNLLKNDVVTGPLVYPIALLPGLAALVFLYGYFRFIREMDELQRKVQIEATMVGVATILTFTLTWGLMEMFLPELPRVPMFWIFPLYFIVQGFAGWRLSKKYGAACKLI